MVDSTVNRLLLVTSISLAFDGVYTSRLSPDISRGLIQDLNELRLLSHWAHLARSKRDCSHRVEQALEQLLESDKEKALFGKF